MTPPNPDAALIALNRFGLGARPGDLDKAASDPRGFLKADLRNPDVALIAQDDPANAGLLGGTAAIQASMVAAFQRKLDRDRMAASTAMPINAAALPTSAPPVIDGSKPKPAEPPVEQNLFRSEAQARFGKALAAEAGFVERLVYFWSNHFC